MARIYAVSLALIAMTVVFARGIRVGAGFDGTVLTALAWTALMAVVGAVVGMIAEATVDESVRLQIEQELAKEEGSAERPRA